MIIKTYPGKASDPAPCDPFRIPQKTRVVSFGSLIITPTPTRTTLPVDGGTSSVEDIICYNIQIFIKYCHHSNCDEKVKKLCVVQFARSFFRLLSTNSSRAFLTLGDTFFIIYFFPLN